jgi:lipopolysaccharide export system protein LptA
MKSRYLLLLLVMAGVGVGSADDPLPIDIRAEKLELNINGGQQTLTGNVVIEQGSMIISADRIQVDTIKGAISRISGKGSPIVISDNTPGGDTFRASANAIAYQTSQWSIVVEGDVVLEVPGIQIRSERIVYDIRKGLFELTGGATSRVEATLLQASPSD